MGRGRTKKEHFVPQCYLKAWAIENTEQVYVYDKLRDHFRINNIEDIASERFFYDTDFINLLGEEQLHDLLEGNIRIPEDADPQHIEHIYADEVEPLYSEYLQKLIVDARKASQWTIKNCYFVMPGEKELFSQLLAIQFLRTKQIRNDILESSKLLAKSLLEMGFPAEETTKYELSRDQTKNIHVRMLNDFESLKSIAISLYYLTWVLCINRTNMKFYTSDSPIVRKAHIHDPILGMNGLRSRGVEVFIPIAPDLILVMFDGEYHGLANQDMRYADLCSTDNVDYYNSLTIMGSDTCIYSQDGDWALVQKMKSSNPDVFSKPRIQLK